MKAVFIAANYFGVSADIMHQESESITSVCENTSESHLVGNSFIDSERSVSDAHVAYRGTERRRTTAVWTGTD